MPDESVQEAAPSASSGGSTLDDALAERVAEYSSISRGVGAPSWGTNTQFCENCLKYDNFNVKSLHPKYWPKDAVTPTLFCTLDQIRVTARTCALCELVLCGLESSYHDGHRGWGPLEEYASETSGIFVSMWPCDEEEETTISFYMWHEEERNRCCHYPARLTEINMRLYVERESGVVGYRPSDKHWRAKLRGVLARPQPVRPWSNECIHLLKTWIDICIKEHGDRGCSRGISSEDTDESMPPVLPTRVIDVAPENGSGNPRLLITNGARGHYTALSYCWGVAQKSERPYLTTSGTVEQHLSAHGLPWKQLPKTIQDAILLTRAIGLRYVWIDSLCIVQDSNEDWEKEAATMGTVYARARLVIAATFGEDANSGLFPFWSQLHRPGQPSLYFRRLSRSYRTTPPFVLPLFGRGWTTQEWVLARRIVFWAEERMCWRCMCQCLQDDGETMGDAEDPASYTKNNSGLFERYPSWIEIVKLYSRRHLTYPGDKLVALQGIVNEIQKRKPGDWYTFGSWQSNMPWELFSGRVKWIEKNIPSSRRV